MKVLSHSNKEAKNQGANRTEFYQRTLRSNHANLKSKLRFAWLSICHIKTNKLKYNSLRNLRTYLK